MLVRFSSISATPSPVAFGGRGENTLQKRISELQKKLASGKIKLPEESPPPAPDPQPEKEPKKGDPPQ